MFSAGEVFFLVLAVAIFEFIILWLLCRVNKVTEEIKHARIKVNYVGRGYEFFDDTLFCVYFQDVTGIEPGLYSHYARNRPTVRFPIDEKTALSMQASSVYDVTFIRNECGWKIKELTEVS